MKSGVIMVRERIARVEPRRLSLRALWPWPFRRNW